MNCTPSFALAAALLAAAPAAAQVSPASPATPAAPQTPAAPPQRPQVTSPVVDGDKTTFAIYAPKATEVTLSSGEIDRLIPGRNKPFTKAENGVWSLSVSPLPPGIYKYAITVDGVSMADPSSPNVVGNVRGARGTVEVPGPAGTPRHDEWRPIAHGSLTQHWYQPQGDADAPPHPRLHAGRLRRVDEEVPGPLSAARRRRQRRALVAAGPRQRDRRQPAGRRQDGADAHRHDRRPPLSAAAGRAGRTREGDEDVPGRSAARGPTPRRRKPTASTRRAPAAPWPACRWAAARR